MWVIGTLLLFLMPLTVHAASGTVKVTGASTAIVGNNVTMTVTLSSSTAIGSWNLGLNYNKSYLSLVSSTAEAGGTIMANSSSGTKSKSYTFVFKVLKSGSTTVSISSYEAYAYADLSEMSLSITNKNITLMTQQELEATYSKDNYLKSLSIEGYTITPEFDKDTLEYSAVVPSDITSINIVATKNDSKASVVGDGEKAVLEGSNAFEIVVTAQNGATRTYTLNVEVEDLTPIEIVVNNESYSIVKRQDVLTKPTTYTETTVTINDVEVPAFTSEITGYTLVGIKDKNGNVYLAIYDKEDNTYTMYNEFVSNGLILYLTDFKEEVENYIKSTITINSIEIPVFKYKENSRFVICYGMNIETGEYDYYSYDTKEETFQVWNQEELEELKSDLKTYMYVILAFGIGLLFAFILIICLLSNNKKRKKKLKQNDSIEEISEDQKKVTEEQKEKKEEVTIDTDEEMYDLLKDMKKKKKERDTKAKKK